VAELKTLQSLSALKQSAPSKVVVRAGIDEVVGEYVMVPSHAECQRAKRPCDPRNSASYALL
jgi:hypothetical protein